MDRQLKIIISPAKKMKNDNDIFLSRNKPEFLKEAKELYNHLSGKNFSELKLIWACSDAVANSSCQIMRAFRGQEKGTAAIFSYEGLQYQHIAPSVMTEEELEYLQEHLIILSGLFGGLRPFDEIKPYRLEMQSKVDINIKNSLYLYWGDKIANKFIKDSLVINLASLEYSKVITKYVQPENVVTFSFCQKVKDKLVQRGTLAKSARGEMVRFMAQNKVSNVEELKNFSELGFSFSREDSTPNSYVYIRG